MPDEKADENLISDDVAEDDDLSETSNAAASLCTSLSTLAQEYRRSQQHICPPGIEDDELVATDERWHAYRSTPAFDDGRQNDMFSNLRSLTLS